MKVIIMARLEIGIILIKCMQNTKPNNNNTTNLNQSINLKSMTKQNISNTKDRNQIFLIPI